MRGRGRAEFQLSWCFPPTDKESWVVIGELVQFGGFSHLHSSVLPSLCLFEVQKNCGVVQKDTLCGVTWNFQVCLSHHLHPETPRRFPGESVNVLGR